MLFRSNSRQYIAQIEARERGRTGIQSLKVRFNNIFGYYIEISKANLHLAPDDYERKQTLVNAERFTTPELKEYERKVLEAEERILTIERELFDKLRQRIERTIVPEPPLSFAEGGVIRSGVEAALDELRDLSHNSKRVVAQIEERERQRTGVGSLKVKFNSVFGYYIEISKPNLHLAPADYERKQTLVNAERFTTPELKEYERKVLEAEERILAIERELIEKLRARVAGEAQRIRGTAAAVAELDVCLSLAHAAAECDYVRPSFSADGEMQIAGGRHPVIERLAERERAERFISNDLYLNNSSDLIAVITGPNMGGKSTYLRQAALISILAQMGSFIPAASARLPVVDRIFTRIGASDNLALGRSTFMVEMTETAQILNKIGRAHV